MPSETSKKDSKKSQGEGVKNKMTKEEILSVISGMSLENVQGSQDQGQGSVSNIIEMTSAIVEEIVLKISQGKGLRDIRKEVKGSSGESLSWKQIREVMKVRREFLASLEE